MSTPITEYASVTVAVADRLLQAIDFGKVAIFGGIFTEPAAWDTGQRSAEYTTLAGLGVDFATTTKVYKAAQAIFTADSEFPAPSSVKVLRQDSGDADITAALDAIELADPEWYAMCAVSRTEADINEIAAWIEAASNPHKYYACSEDAGVIDGADTTDIASDLNGLSYSRTLYMWHHEGGVDHPTGNTLAVVGAVATMTRIAHGFRVGDSITVSGVTGGPTGFATLNGNKTIATVPTADTYTFASPGTTTDAPATGTIVVFGRYSFPEARIVGMFIPQPAGKMVLHGKALVGQTPAPTSLLNLTQQRVARAKMANVYTTIGGLGALQEGKMASGRFADIQLGIDWLAVRLAEAINQRLLSVPKVPYTDGGIQIFRADIAGVLQTGQVNGLLADRLVNDTKGRAWIIDIPALEDIPAADRAARNLPNVVVTVRFAGAIQNISIAVNAGL